MSIRFTLTALTAISLLGSDTLSAQSEVVLRPGKYPGSLKITQTDQNGQQQTGNASFELNVISVSPSGDVVASVMAYAGAYGGGDVRGRVEPDGTLRLTGTIAMRPGLIEARVSGTGQVIGRYTLGDAWPRTLGEFSLACNTCAPVAAAPVASAPAASAKPAVPAPTPTPARPSTPAAPAPAAPAAPAAAGMNTAGLIGDWSLSLPGAVSITDSRQRVDAQTVEKTSKVTITTGQAGMGSLTIRADGTYRLVWDSKTTTGRWDRSPGYPFAGSIRLLDAHPQKHWDDRNWYVFVKDDGEKEARFPPHTGYDAVRLRPTR